MMNIRTASLDPNLPKASRDCRVCNRRRIKCDRTIPSCKKCGIRNLECTGFERKLKWDQGIASRGQYAGQAAPIPRKTVSTNRDCDSSSPKQRASSKDSAHSVQSPPSTDMSFTHVTATNNALNEDDIVEDVDADYGVDLSLSWSQTPHIYQDLDVRRLVNHYDHHVAATFVWIDSPENRWRNDVLPLAQESSSLLSAILALSSSHLSSKSPVNESSSIQISRQSDQYRDYSLKLLAQQLEDEAQKSSSPKSIISILATMLILCNLEMVHSDSKVWRVHLQASHTMIRRWFSTASAMDLLDSTSRFIITQFSILDTFASTSSFRDVEEIFDIACIKGEPTIFSDYLEIIHDVTVEERKRTATRQAGGTLTRTDLNCYVEKLENARVMTKTLSRNFYFGTEHLRRDFDRVVDIYHNSGLIYAYEALAEPVDSVICIPPLLRVLLQDLTLIAATGHFAQDLAWPLFITGTACRHLKDEQILVERLFQDSMKSTGFSSCQEALKFLRIFWLEKDIERDNWIEFARRYALQGQEFLIF